MDSGMNEIIESAVFPTDILGIGIDIPKGKYENLRRSVPVSGIGLAVSPEEDILNRWKQKQFDRWSLLPKGRFEINASAYTASADECGNSNGKTASGLRVQERRTIACPPSFPFGAKLAIEGLGVFRCEDRGGAIKGNRFDIYMKTKNEAFVFGRQHLVAEVVSD